MITALFDDFVNSLQQEHIPDRLTFVGPLGRIAEHWNLWIEAPSTSGSSTSRTVLFVCSGSLMTSEFIGIGEQNSSDPAPRRYRPSCISSPTDDSDSSELLFSVDMDPSLELWRDDTSQCWRQVCASTKVRPLEQGQVDVLIDAVRQSMELDEDQKDCMIEGIRAFEIRDPQN